MRRPVLVAVGCTALLAAPLAALQSVAPPFPAARGTQPSGAPHGGQSPAPAGAAADPGHVGALETALDAHEFALTTVGDVSDAAAFLLRNASDAPVVIEDLALEGAGADQFEVLFPPPLPHAMRPGQELLLSVRFAPQAAGPHAAELAVDQGLPAEVTTTLGLSGLAVGPLGADWLVDAGGAGLAASDGDFVADLLWAGGAPAASVDAVDGTEDDALFQARREGPAFAYALPVQPGHYAVELGFAETVETEDGARVFTVAAEGDAVLPALDVHALAGHDAAHVEAFEVSVLDGVLELSFEGVTGDAQVAWIAVRAAPLVLPSVDAIDFGTVAGNAAPQTTVTLVNLGLVPALVEQLALLPGEGGGAEAFTVFFGPGVYQGAATPVVEPVAVEIPPLGSKVVVVQYVPSGEGEHAVDVELSGEFGAITLPVVGEAGHDGHPFLHVVIEGETQFVDHDQLGTADVQLDGSASHTHEPGVELALFEWRVDGALVATGPVLDESLAIGPHTIELRIHDDGEPSESLSGSVGVQVVPASGVPGVLARYFDVAGSDPAALLDAPPSTPVFAEVLDGFEVPNGAGVGESGLDADVIVQLDGRVPIPADGDYSITAVGGQDSRIYVDGQLVQGTVPLLAGDAGLVVRFAVDDVQDLPLSVLLGPADLGPAPIAPEGVIHDQTSLKPVLNDLPSGGSELGGNGVVIEGLGFFPVDQVSVLWGAQVLGPGDLIGVKPNRIGLVAPPGTGTVDVSVQTPNGQSNARTYAYSPNGPVPVSFAIANEVPFEARPTVGAFGPDGRYYAGLIDGRLAAVEFDDDWGVLSLQHYPGVSALPNHNVLGIAFDPFDPAGPEDPVRVYLAHGEHFLNGGSSFTGPSPYTGQVTRLAGPAFDAPEPVVTGLPTSNHDHAVNGIVFDHSGDLLILVGSNTNAGVPHPNSGDLPESPLSAALLKAETSRPDFDGAVTYQLTSDGTPTADQVDGHDSDLAPGAHVSVIAPGLRNPFDLVLHTNGRLYATDNGPNVGFGEASTGAATQAPDPYAPDELLLVEPGRYYGAANRNRGRDDGRENVWRATDEPTEPGVYAAPIEVLPSSTNGITEYRSAVFGSQLRGDLIVQKWANRASRIELSGDGREVLGLEQIGPWTGGLSVEFGPGGALLVTDYGNKRTKVLAPQDVTPPSLRALDVTPWRGVADGGQRFVLAGVGFGTLANTTVTFGGIEATLTDVRPTRVEGLLPANPAPTTELVDVVVGVGLSTSTLQGAFRWLLPKGAEPAWWEPAADAPLALGAAVGGAIDGVLYAVGEGDPRVLAWDLEADAWSTIDAVRPYPGRDHAAAVLEGELWLVGGVGAASEGRVQVFDPQAGTWRTQADLPWPGGAVSLAAIDGRLYAAGGVVGATTVEDTAVYDPATDAWTMLAPMPLGNGRHHASSGTDGERLWVIGGRGIGSGDGDWLANGFGDVFAYDPATDAWAWSGDGVSGIPPLPQARADAGAAVFHLGELWVAGGETLDGPGADANGVYDRVDVLDPATLTWRSEAPLLQARHGHATASYEGRLFVACGGEQAGPATSVAAEVVNDL